jgi:hypothetical protein
MLAGLGLMALAGSPGGQDEARYAARTAPVQASANADPGSAIRASRQVFDERRANWERHPDAQEKTALR